MARFISMRMISKIVAGEPTCAVKIPANWRSGFYALELTADGPSGPVESYVSFFVTPPRGRATAPLLFVASTATFLAYANIGTRLDQSGFEVHSEGLVTLSADDVYLSEHRELGLSSYDTHLDGSGVCYSSGARPILSMRVRGNSFNYVNDTHILDWLEQQNIEYDVLTDEDIDRQGASALSPYRTVITGSHPEYVSRPMLDAFEAYQNSGGRHMYLGGNGFYWRIAFHPTRRGLIEVRRGVTGTRTWEGEAGETNLSFTGEPSALWRSNGRAPQRLVGVGFDAQVFDHSTFYRRLPDSFDPRMEFAFQGIGPDERIGDFGLRLGGAAGLEIDRADQQPRVAAKPACSRDSRSVRQRRPSDPRGIPHHAPRFDRRTKCAGARGHRLLRNALPVALSLQLGPSPGAVLCPIMAMTTMSVA